MRARMSSLYDAGTLALQQGRLDDALSLLRLVAQRTPDNELSAQAWGNLGVGLRRLGRDLEAKEAFESALAQDPQITSARFNLANTLRAIGNIQEALKHYQALCQAHPNRADYANNMGAALMALGRAPQAEKCFRRAVDLKPDDAHYWGNLASAQASSGRQVAPLRSLQEGLKLNPKSSSLLVKLGHHLVEQGHLDAAAKAFGRAVRVDPERLDTVAGVATVLHRKGDNEAAREVLAPLIESGSLSPNLVATWTQICRRTGHAQAAIAPLQAQIAQVQDPATQVLLQHNLGDVLDSVGRYDEAFLAYKQANDLRALPHDMDAHSRWVDRLIAQPPAPHRAEQADPRPVLIVGMPRSGTSLVEQILASHPQCHGAGELDELRHLSMMASESSGRLYPDCLQSLSASSLSRMAEAYLQRLCRQAPGAARITDKMPQNFLYLGLAQAMLPGARVIHCVRDPVDTALSCYFQHFKDTLAFTTQLDWLARWTADYQRLMAHWDATLSLPILHVPYAQLCQDPQGWAAKIVDFTGLDWDPSCLESHTHKRVVRTASYAQVRQPIYTTSIGRSSAYARHISELTGLRETHGSELCSTATSPVPKTHETGGGS